MSRRRQDQRCEIEARVPLRESDPAWYVVKAYSRTARTPDQLDVHADVDRVTRGTWEGPWPEDSEVALTSPFYFRRPGTAADPPPLVSHVRLRLVDPTTGEPVRDATMMVTGVGMPFFGRDVVFSMLAPLGLSQLILAVWLVAKGSPNQP